MNFTDIPYRLHHLYRSIRCWFHVSNNRQHWEMTKTALESYPFDYCYLLYLEQDKLKEMLTYFEKGHITTPETYDHMKRYLRLAIKMLDIMLSKADTFTYDGDMKFIELEEKDENGEPLYRMDGSNLVYHCKVNVNLSNINRFIHNDSMRSFCLNHPHELYEIKAKHLYYKIRLYHTEEWWD